jgi:hypothetical protein
MLLSFWSPKGGSGTSVVSAACAVLLGRVAPVRLADFGGDQAAVLGLSVDTPSGLSEWLTVGPEAPADALDRLAVDAGHGVALLPRGTGPLWSASPEAGAALGVVLANDPRITVADVAGADAPALHALVEVSDASIVIVRDCYLGLRRAVRNPLVERASGVIVVHEHGRALGTSEIRDVLDVPVLATVDTRPSTARIVDSGVLPTRITEHLARPLQRALETLGLPGREGRAA